VPQLFPQLTPLLEEAFEAYSDVTWEIGLTFFPDPAAGPGEIAAFVGLLAECSGASLGSVVRATALLNPTGQTQETINEAARLTYEKLQGLRSNQLAAMAQQQEEALANGKPSPVSGSGLILPS
jgi:hypothetical protein